MSTINIYDQYFGASAKFNGIQRNGALVLLIADSNAGMIQYDIAVSFFPYETPDDFRITYDAYFSRTIYQAKGRRSKKREAEFLNSIQTVANELAAEQQATIHWEKTLYKKEYSKPGF